MDENTKPEVVFKDDSADSEQSHVETVHVTPAHPEVNLPVDEQPHDPTKDSSPADPVPFSETPQDDAERGVHVNSDDQEAPEVDPGNTPPAAWTSPMTGDEIDEVSGKLDEEFPPAAERDNV